MRMPKVTISRPQRRQAGLVLLFGGFLAYVFTALFLPQMPVAYVGLWLVAVLGAFLYGYEFVRDVRAALRSQE